MGSKHLIRSTEEVDLAPTTLSEGLAEFGELQRALARLMVQVGAQAYDQGLCPHGKWRVTVEYEVVEGECGA